MSSGTSFVWKFSTFLLRRTRIKHRNKNIKKDLNAIRENYKYKSNTINNAKKPMNFNFDKNLAFFFNNYKNDNEMQNIRAKKASKAINNI